MNFKRILWAGLALLMCASASFAATDAEGYPVMYLRGAVNNWSAQDQYKFTRSGETYTLNLSSLDGEFKIADDNWQFEYGSPNSKNDAVYTIDDAVCFQGISGNGNIKANNLSDVKIYFDIKRSGNSCEPTMIYVDANGHKAPVGPVVDDHTSGTLPVLYINVYEEDGVTLNNEIIDRNLSHKNYFKGEYWLDLNGCEWLEELGAKSVGSAEEPLPLEIKARGNYTRRAFSKKPFKLKLAAKQKLLGMTNNKHWAILAHADDTYGYLRNFTGFNLGNRIGLPWAPAQQPIEVVINGDYRGLYFLTESIRVDSKRVNIQELDDLVTDPTLISGGYLVELDNYDEENQIRMPEQTCANIPCDMLRVTWDTPEEYSDIQKRFITDQFTTMNNAIGQANRSDEIWRYMDMDDAVRYYIVEELISHTEAYHGSTYLFRDRGEGQKWHFSPLWDCGNAFNGPTDGFFYENSYFGATWIPSLRRNDKFNQRLADTWKWFMNNGFNGIYEDMSLYAERLKAAAQADYKRWHNAPLPDGAEHQEVVDNRDMDSRLAAARDKLSGKVNWLKSQFGDFTHAQGATEPTPDDTEAAPLPSYAREDAKPMTIYFLDQQATPWSLPHAYVWSGNPVVQHLGAWPGTSMTLVADPAAVVPASTGNQQLWSVSYWPEGDREGHRVIFNDGYGNQTDSKGFEVREGAYYTHDGMTSDCPVLEVPESDAPAAIYNLQGIRIDAPQAGRTYIRVSGDKAVKVRNF